MATDLIEFSLLANEFDKEAKTAELSWDDLAHMLTTHERRTPDIRANPSTGEIEDMAKHGFAWIPATFKTPLARGNAHVKTITVATFDLDGVPYLEGEVRALDKHGKPKTHRTMTQAEWYGVLQRIDASGLAAAVHSSYRYSPEAPKGRVAFRLSRPMLPGEWPIVRLHLDDLYKLNCDRSTKDLTRLYFLPAAPHGAPVFAAITDGTAVVNVDEIVKGHRVEALTASIQAGATQRTQDALAAAKAASDVPVDLDLLRKFLKTAQGANASLIKTALKGESFASEGGRDNAVNNLCAAARFAVPANTPTEALVEIFRESLSRLPHNPGEDWINEARKKLDRHQERRIVHDSARQAQQDEASARLRAEAARSAYAAPRRADTTPKEANDLPGSSDEPEPDLNAFAFLNVGPYSEADLAQWATDQGCVDVLDFQRRWIITRGNANYVFVEGRYLPPVPRENLEHSLQRDLARSPCELVTVDGKGNKKLKDTRLILHDYSTVARETQADLALQQSFYEPHTQTYHEAVTPLRNLKAEYHQEVQDWLDLLDPKGKLTDWVACVPRLDRQLCAVYIDGPKGCGKTLIASGLARLWTTGAPSALSRILEGFNESIIQCPLILADEGLPQKKGITAELRNLIGTTSRTLNRKFLPMVSLKGSLRLVIAGNNDRLLDTGEELSANDLDAVASRIFYLKTNKAPSDYLERIGGPPKINKWINDDIMAEHSLYLRNTRKVNENARFLVEGDTGTFHRHLAMGSGVSGTVCEWLVRRLADKSPSPTSLIQIGQGELWVNTGALATDQAWVRYVPSFKVPSATSIAKALRGIATRVVSVNLGGEDIQYHQIDSELILTAVERLQMGDPNAIRAKLNQGNMVIAAHQFTRGAS